jgi:hypothetical protein
MKRFLVGFLVSILFAFGLAQDTYTGMLPMNKLYSERLFVGVNEVEVLDASGGDATPATIINSRAFRVDVAGIIKITYTSDQGAVQTEVLYANAGQFYPYRNISKLFRYYVGTTAGTAKSYSAAGAEVTNAIKIYR